MYPGDLQAVDSGRVSSGDLVTPVLVSAPEPRALIFYQFILCAIESGVSGGEQARVHGDQVLGDQGGEAHVGEDVALEVDARGYFDQA
jgi:hypothetical protein